MVTLIRVPFATVDTRSSSTGAGHHRSTCLLLLIVLSDLTNKVAKRLVNVNALLSRRFNKLATEVLCEVAALIHSDLSLILKITLVGHDDDRKRILILDAKNLLVESANFLERIAGGDGVDEEKTFTGAHVLLAHSSIFLLTSGIKDVKQCDLLVNDTLFAVRVLDCWIVFVDELALDELDGEG